MKCGKSYINLQLMVGSILLLQLGCDNDPPLEVVIDFDGNNYNTIRIGNQIWMQENLKAKHYADGEEIVFIEEENDWEQLNVSDKAYFGFSEDTYGFLYTWAAVMDGAKSSDDKPSRVQGVCPTGWHLPSDAEWTELIKFLGEDSIAGGKMREQGTAHWKTPNRGTTNESGFTGLPGGRFEGSIHGIGDHGKWWSSSEITTDEAWSRLLINSGAVSRTGHNKKCGLSVRCLKD